MVQKAVVTVLRSFDKNIIFIELQDVYRKACRALLEGILGCAAYRDGIQQAKRALRRFPKDHELLELQASLKIGLKGRMEGYKGMGAGSGELPALTRWGKIYQKPYPWLKEELNHRTPALLEQINKKFGAGNCEVSRVVFDSLGSGPMGANDDNTGPLGIFATKDTKAGDIVVVDESITGISTVSPRRLEHCDACHGTLTVPYQLPHETVKAPCCGKVAYCGMKCWNSFKKYHEIICEKDFEWLYTDDNHGANGQYTRGSKWRPIMFLRIMAIILGDRKVATKEDKALQHPLQHPLIARMAANYASNSGDSPDGYWQYFENVTAPTKILMMLGIDVFADQEFTPEVITTIYWRLENNANMSSMNLYPETALTTLEPSKSKYAHLTDEEYKELYDRNAVHLVSINSQYLFFNHSCEPNVSWHGAIPDPSVDISWLRGYDGKFQKVGSSTVFCRASRDIKKGEELKISYIGNPKGTQDNGDLTAKQSRQAKRACLTKWFPNGCGCQVCEEENRPATESFAVVEGS
ncbi:hypothetical protein B0O99DRAFT_520093 [Bisporella sp. PMI_857]|nr:hypothetical protein B0O99DRAFT_520093 [Bisporella sp. PMI_857]